MIHLSRRRNYGKIAIGLLAGLALAVSMSGPVFVLADTTILFSDSFGSQSNTTIHGWVVTVEVERENKIDAKISVFDPRVESNTTGHVRVRQGASITAAVSTIGHENIVLRYYWRGDNEGNDSANNRDTLKVLWRLAGAHDFIEINEHLLKCDKKDYPDCAWSGLVSVPLPATARNTNIEIRFLGNTNADKEEARVDDVSISGDSIPPAPGTISGTKFEDMNGNGVKDFGEPGLAGWTINLFDGTATTTAVTMADDLDTKDIDETGVYRFTDVPAGTYTVTEVSQNGWTQTTESPAAITIQSGTVIEHVDFGNFKEVIITGFKWDDRNGDGVWQKEGDNAEPALADTQIKLQGIEEHSPACPVDTELVQLALTGGNGSFRLHAFCPGTYRLTEVTPQGSQQTAPANSFFDIFVELSGEEINQGFPGGRPAAVIGDPLPLPALLEFGNAKYHKALGGKFVPVSGDSASTTSAVVLNPMAIDVSFSGGTSTVSILGGTTITRVDGSNFDLGALTASGTDPSALSGLGTGVAAAGALQWGLEGLGLNFNPAITVSIFVGPAFNGQTLSVLRSASGSSGWTSDGIVSPATCVVAEGLCVFSATKASYYAAIYTAGGGEAVVVAVAGGGGGGGGGGSAGMIFEYKETVVADRAAIITWSTNYNATSRVVYDTVPSVSGAAGPDYGYRFSTAIFDAPYGVTQHRVSIDGLLPGTTYYYALISSDMREPSERSFVTAQAVLPAPQTGASEPPPRADTALSPSPLEARTVPEIKISAPSVFSLPAVKEPPPPLLPEVAPEELTREEIPALAGEPSVEIPKRPALFMVANVLTLGTGDTMVALMVAWIIMILCGGGAYYALRSYQSLGSSASK